MFDELDANIIRKLRWAYIRTNDWLTSKLNKAIQTDTEGIRPSVLRETLENWPAGKPMPKLLYTVPVRGSFPSSYAASTESLRSMAAILRG